MTEKELHKLRRQDLLQLLLSQGKEALALQTKLNDTNAALIRMEAGFERLKDKLNDKDALIEKLKGRLDRKDVRIHELEKELRGIRLNREIQLEEAGSIAEAALRLNDVFETAQKAADQYIYNLQRMAEQKAAQPQRNAGEAAGWEGLLAEPKESAQGGTPLEIEEEAPLEINQEDWVPDAKREEEVRKANGQEGDRQTGTEYIIPEFGRSRSGA